MKICLKKLSIYAVVLLIGFIFFSSSAIAEGPYEPYLDYAGAFDYVWSTKSLSLNNIAFSFVRYIDGSTETDYLNDPVLGASIVFGNIYNTAGNTTHFDNGSGGGVYFEISDGSYTYLTATLAPMDVSTAFNKGFMNSSPMIDFNLTNVSLGTGFSSQYIDELRSIDIEDGAMQFSSTFTCNAGGCPMLSNGFTAVFDFSSDTSGTIQGIVSAPEPVSSLLFVAGGVTLAFRRFFRKRI